MATAWQVTSYDYQLHGGANGYQGNRAIIRLYGAVGTLAYVHAVPAGNPIPGRHGLAALDAYVRARISVPRRDRHAAQ